MSILRLKSWIDSLWAKYATFRVMSVVAFLVFITIMALLISQILHEYSPMLLAISVWLIIGLIIGRLILTKYFQNGTSKHLFN